MFLERPKDLDLHCILCVELKCLIFQHCSRSHMCQKSLSKTLKTRCDIFCGAQTGSLHLKIKNVRTYSFTVKSFYTLSDHSTRIYVLQLLGIGPEVRPLTPWKKWLKVYVAQLMLHKLCNISYVETLQQSTVSTLQSVCL